MGYLVHEFRAVIRRQDTAATAAASIQSGTSETWDFSGVPLTLTVSVDGGAAQTVTFVSGDFTAVAAATADEVAARIETDLTGAEGYVSADDEVIIGTETTGSSGSIQVTGGTANSILQFPTIDVSGGGYDSIFGGLVPVDDGSQQGLPTRRERPALTLRCQVSRNDWGRQDMTAGGLEQRADIIIRTLASQVQSLGLVDSNNMPIIKAGDRLVRIERVNGDTEWAFDDPPGMWVSKVMPASYGLSASPVFEYYDFHFVKARQGQ